MRPLSAEEWFQDLEESRSENPKTALERTGWEEVIFQLEEMEEEPGGSGRR